MKKYTVITGASSGIGKAIAKLFSKKSKNLILIARRIELLKELKSEILSTQPNIDIILKEFDLTKIEKLVDLYSSLKEYSIETWINNAGVGILGIVSDNDINRVINMVNLNVQAVTVLSTLFVKDYKDIEGTQLINISSAAGYIISPEATTYCATKFFVSAFTEGLNLEMKNIGAKLRAKVLCPAATKTEFASKASDRQDYSYFENSNTSDEVAEHLYKLYESDATIGFVNFEDLSLELSEPKFRNIY
ncbi:SDR family oxidoreductase [Fusobacterium sp. 1001295B_180824_G3]|uniref:SDR family NAD(P)-dependent oxidoreductase n=1 Tax=Fusobacterium sp. 1001295B_180824_G3 TaxID=2787123 RepID=UPI0018978868|nr:SDR family NAD(P)-dependent oxidoreductase [Fusobacterium sp. 1001295B_180824_G3]